MAQGNRAVIQLEYRCAKANKKWNKVAALFVWRSISKELAGDRWPAFRQFMAIIAFRKNTSRSRKASKSNNCHRKKCGFQLDSSGMFVIPWSHERRTNLLPSPDMDKASARWKVLRNC